MSESEKLVYSAAESNKNSIVDVLEKYFLRESSNTRFLEVASGAGQHAAFFAEKFPNVEFQPSEVSQECLKSIQIYVNEYRTKFQRENLLNPIFVDLLQENQLEPNSFDFVFCSNLFHITSMDCAISLFQLSQKVLKTDGFLISYGPFALPPDGRISPESNRQFHASLQNKNPTWGLKRIDHLTNIAENFQLKLNQIFDVPCNNKIVTWKKK